jgi:hypothetical protein
MICEAQISKLSQAKAREPDSIAKLASDFSMHGGKRAIRELD